jgi:predicted dehydrogenase
MVSNERAVGSPGGGAAGVPIGVGAVGVRPDEEAGILAELPQGDLFRFVAFSDEGLPPVPRREEPGEPEPEELGESEPDETAAYYSDYNVLLQDSDVELVLVDGPVALRRDFSVRALNAGRHVVVAPPFCETALDAERVAKTAARKGLVATMDVKWRDDADLGALRAALDGENVSSVQGAFLFCAASGAEAAGAGLLEQIGVSVLDQMHAVLRQDIKSVSAHLQRPAPGKPDHGFLLYMPLRSGGWAICQATTLGGAAFPRWTLYTAQTSFAVSDGRAVATTAGSQRTYGAPEGAVIFWQNLYEAIREGTELKCHPADIVRGMKWHEAAFESDELGEPVTV